LAVSPTVVDGLERMNLNVPVRLVPNAIDVERFHPKEGWREAVRERLGIAAGDFVAICAGQVQPRKGVDAFIRTAREMPEVTFVWVGGTPFKRLTASYDRMRRAVAHAPGNCLFVGDVPYDEMPEYFAAADCLLFPSIQETFGLAILEAAAAGLPLVLRDLPTYDSLFTGAYLAGDEGSFAGLVASLRDDPDLRARYADLAGDLATRFDTQRHGELLLDAYGDVLARAEGERASSARRLRPALQWAFAERTPRR
jgi:1,2-diacylglycerol-3-alpha-glucose alpha-1,2-galactosyltransferase